VRGDVVIPLLLLLCGSALAGEEADLPLTPEEPPAVEEEPLEPLTTRIEGGQVVHELWVYGDIRVEQAREEVVQAFADEGYTEVEDKGDYLRLRAEAPWKGEVRLYRDGWVRMKRRPVQFQGPEMPWAKKNSPLAYAGCLIYPWACISAGGQLVSGRKLQAQKVRALETAYLDVQELGDRVADRETESTVNTLPEQLEELWYRGVPLSEGPTLETVQERKAALLDYWDSRTDTVWGDRVRVAVEAFLRAEVQGTEHAYTREEVADFNERRQCTRVLDLEGPWEEVTADVDPPW
jgi:hypothetical protein